MKRTTAIVLSAVSISTAAILVALLAFALPAATAANQNGTERMSACLAVGGSWLETSESTSCTQ